MKAAARSLLGSLAKNVAAGTRLALFLPVSRLDFRISAANYATLVVAGLLFWIAGGMLRVGFPGQLDLAALTAALAQIPLLLAGCLLVAAIFGRSSLLAPLAVLFTSTDVLFEVAGSAVYFVFLDERLASYAGAANWLYMAWVLATLLRAQWLLTGWRLWRSIAAAGVIVLMLAVFVWIVPRSEGWTPIEEAQEADSQPSLLREDLFHLQGELLEDRMAELEPERPGVEDIYFVGVAPYALQDTFLHELRVARKIMDERFDTGGRSIVLANHPATLADLPIASASNLRVAIERLAAGMNVEEDVLFLFFTTHGNEAGELAFDLPPLALQQLTPTALARMLNDAGVKWKVIVISACYSGGFVEPLRDENTLIITASDASHPSFGCEAASDITWFGRAFFDEALRRTFSFTEAFAQAKNTIASRERAQGYESSNPQMFVGAAMAAKLASLQARLEALARRRSIQASLN